MVLATGFVHVLNDANTALSNPCLSGAWAAYSWSFTIATLASILTLVMEVAFEAIIRSRMKKPSDVETTVRPGKKVSTSPSMHACRKASSIGVYFAEAS